MNICLYSNYKTVFLFCSIFLGSLSLANAQTFSFGPRVGLNLSDIEGKGATGYGIKPDFAVGLVWNSTREKALNLGGDISFSRQGARIRDSNILTSHTHLNYVNVNLLFKYYFWSDTRTTPVLYAGPQVGYLIYASNSRAGTQTDLFKKTDVSGVLGAALRVDMSRWWWTLDVRFSPGITSIIKTGPMIRNSVLSVNNYFEFGSQTKKKRGRH